MNKKQMVETLLRRFHAESDVVILKFMEDRQNGEPEPPVETLLHEFHTEIHKAMNKLMTLRFTDGV